MFKCTVKEFGGTDNDIYNYLVEARSHMHWFYMCTDGNKIRSNGGKSQIDSPESHASCKGT